LCASSYQAIKLSSYQAIKLSSYQAIKLSSYQAIKLSSYQAIKVSRYQGVKILTEAAHSIVRGSVDVLQGCLQTLQATNKTNETALDIAVSKGHQDVVHMLQCATLMCDIRSGELSLNNAPVW
jgi:hypothetical protein